MWQHCFCLDWLVSVYKSCPACRQCCATSGSGPPREKYKSNFLKKWPSPLMEAFSIPVLNYPSESNGQWARRARCRTGGREADSTGAEISNTEMFVNLWNLFRMRSFRKKKSWNWGQINVKGDSLCRIWGGCALKLGLSEVWRVSQRRRGRSPYSRGAAADASVRRQGEQTVAGYLPSVM